MAWTNISKPGAQTYTNANPQGKEQYDQPSVTYDSSTTYYDGENPNQWTDVLKPTTVYTWDTSTFSWSSRTTPWQSPTWNLVNKPT